MSQSKTSLTRVASILAETLKGFKVEETMKVHPIWKNWHAIAGDTIASRSRPQFVQNGVLIVETVNSTWANELEMQKKKLLKKINDQNFGFIVKEIRFRVQKD